MATSGAAPASATMRSASAGAAALRHHETAQIVGLGYRRREPDAGELRREAKQPRQAEREQIAALRGHQRVQLVEDHALERAEQIRRVGGGEQQRHLLRRGQQNLRRIATLALALRGRRVAGAGLDADRQPHLGNRRFQIARDIDGKRLERRDVERVQAAVAADAAAGRDELSPCAAACGNDRRAQLHQARQKSGQRLAAAGRRDQQHRAPGLARWPKVPTDARAASSRGWRTSARTAPVGRLGVRGRSPARSSEPRHRGRGLRHHDETIDRHALFAAHRGFGEMHAA